MTERESAVEHLRNAQQLCRALEDTFHEKGLDMLARDVHHIELRIVLALDEMQREVKELQARLGSTVDPMVCDHEWWEHDGARHCFKCRSTVSAGLRDAKVVP